MSLFFFGVGGGGAESERSAGISLPDSVLGRGKLCPFCFFGGGAEAVRSAGISLRIQCLGGGNCVLFFGGGEQGLSGVLVFLYGFSAWEGKTVSFFFGGGGAESERSAGISLRIQCWGGENCVLLFSGGGGERSLSGALVFLYGFSAWEGKTVSFFFWGGGGGAESERSAGISLRIQCLGGENCVLFFFGGSRV